LNRKYSGLEEILSRLQASEGYALVRAGEADDSRLVGLDSNENYFVDVGLVRKMAEDAARCDLRVYPREETIELRKMLGQWLQIDPKCIVLANGEDQLIDLAATILLRQGSAISISPTYSMYRLRVELVGGKVIQVPLQEDFSLDVPRLISAADQAQALIMFLCSPNNPTGNQFSETDIVEVLNKYPGLVVVDEAYVDFTEHSLVPLIRTHPNLVLIRTFSKAFGMAGARLGYMVANAELSKALAEKAQLPYPISRFTARLGIECLRNLEAIRDGVSKMKQERKWLMERLTRIKGFRSFNSETNFILVCTGQNSAKISAGLRLLGVSVKDIGDVLGYRGCFRATVGTRSMNEKLLNAIGEVMSDGQI
jgi:histidinol-phosphate aminotransferase